MSKPNWADVNAKNKSGETALIWASTNGFKNIVEMLLKAGADIEETEKELKESLQDTLKPKSFEDILTDLKKDFDLEMFKLDNNKKIWVYEDAIRDMGGEWIWALQYLDEEGYVHFLDDDIIQLVKDPTERQNLYNWNASLE